MKRKRKRVGWWLLALVPLALGILAATLQSWGARDRAAPADAILIFGARVNSRGEASPILRARTRHAFDLWRQKLAPKIVCTGGVGDFAPAEAEVSARLLQNWGVPTSAIILENRSTSTRENAQFAVKLLPKGARVVAVSQPFHLWRCRRECERAGLVAFTSPEWEGWNSLSVFSKAWYLVRETGAVLGNGW